MSGKGNTNKTQFKTKSYDEIVKLRSSCYQERLREEFDTGLEDGELPLKRVTIEALDFDWLFENDNAKTLLDILGGEDVNREVLTEKSIKIFVEKMWEFY